MRTQTRTALSAAALMLITAAGGCGSGGPGAYLVDMLELTDEAVATTLVPRPGR